MLSWLLASKGCQLIGFSRFTTDANPFYDVFVQWQINKLDKLNKIKFGERFTVGRMERV